MTLINPLIYERCLAHHAAVSKLEFVVPASLPVLYFGDLYAYQKSNLKVVTVALNPSGREFPKQTEPTFKGHRFELDASTPVDLERTLSEYFKRRPYSGWFMAFERVLNCAGLSYGGKLNKCELIGDTALHVDLCSPIATNPTWSYLTEEQKLALTPEGHAIFKQLLQLLNPDVVLASMAWRHLTDYDPGIFATAEHFECVYECPEKITAKGIRPKLSVTARKVGLGGVKPTTFVHASAFRGPFGQFTREERCTAGKRIVTFMNSNSSRSRI